MSSKDDNALEDELERNEKDAERYRYMRAQVKAAHAENKWTAVSPEEMDSMIDAAILAAKK